MLPEPISVPEPIVSAFEWRQRYSDLLALYTAVTRLNSTREWEPLLNQVLDAAMTLARADAGSLMLADERTRELHIAAARNLPDDVIRRARVKIGDGVTDCLAQNSEPVLLVGSEQVGRSPNCAPNHPISSSICAPLAIPGERESKGLAALLVLDRRLEASVFTENDVQLVAAFCAQAAKMLVSARSYRQMSRRAVQLEHLVEISQKLIASLDVDVVLRSIIDRAVELLQCQAGSLLLVDQETHELVFKVAVGPAGEKLVDTRLPPGVGIVGAVAKEGRPLIVNDAKADPRHYRKVDDNTRLTTHSLLCVPLINKERTIGVVEVMNKSNGLPFDDEDCQLLVAFALQGAIALDNARLYSDLRRAFADTVRIIANALESRDPYTAGHTGRVTQIALATAQELGWAREQLQILEIGALLHDIGKIGVADSILYKPTELTQDEYAMMKQHPILGAKMLEGVAALRPMLPYILYHQERYDGKGYPFGLAGNEIPIEGRILAVADTFDAMTSDRPYRKGLSAEEAIAEIERNRSAQFDPDVVDAFQRAMRK
jgi:putative nucleotidyltransferase with HDIG domain